MQAAAVGAARFFERRFSLTMRALGSPKMPRTVVSGRKPGNAYASHSRRFRLPAAAIEIPSSSERPHTRPKPCNDAAFRCVKPYNPPTRFHEDPLFDTLYHAVALEEGATLVTADETYFSKAKGLGGIVSLANFAI
jgi:hypothetical protein